MAQEIINIGTSPNDGSGDPLRVAFAKVNNNFTQLFSTGWFTTESVTIGNTQQEIFSQPVGYFTQAVFQINSIQANSTNSQNITITAAINGDSTDVKYSGHGTLFFGNAVTTFSMGISANNVILYANPLTSDQVNHCITYQITYCPPDAFAQLIAYDGYPEGSVMATQAEQAITTEGQ